MIRIEITKDTFRHLVAGMPVCIQDQYEVRLDPMKLEEMVEALADALPAMEKRGADVSTADLDANDRHGYRYG